MPSGIVGVTTTEPQMGGWYYAISAPAATAAAAHHRVVWSSKLHPLCCYPRTSEDGILNSSSTPTPHTQARCCKPLTASQVAAFELLLRRLIRRAPNAALLSVGTFNFQSFKVGPAQVPNPLYGSGEPTGRFYNACQPVRCD
jgi:hypothetical protein